MAGEDDGNEVLSVEYNPDELDRGRIKEINSDGSEVEEDDLPEGTFDQKLAALRLKQQEIMEEAIKNKRQKEKLIETYHYSQ